MSIPEAFKKYLEYPAIPESLPLAFDSGTILNELTSPCSSCGKNVEDEDFRGEMSLMAGDVVFVKGVAICYECQVVTEVDFRMRNDLSVEFIDDNGNWVRETLDGKRTKIGSDSDDQPTGLWDRIRGIFRI